MRDVLVAMFAFMMNPGPVTISGKFKYVFLLYFHIKSSRSSCLSIFLVLVKSTRRCKSLSFLFYADKSKLSSFSTQKGYPVVVRCTNLPIHIRNGEGIGGGMVIGWLPIVNNDWS